MHRRDENTGYAYIDIPVVWFAGGGIGEKQRGRKIVPHTSPESFIPRSPFREVEREDPDRVPQLSPAAWKRKKDTL